jgi:hypothetical protein
MAITLPVGRYWNFVLFNIIEPILPPKRDEVEVPQARTGA